MAGGVARRGLWTGVVKRRQLFGACAAVALLPVIVPPEKHYLPITVNGRRYRATRISTESYLERHNGYFSTVEFEADCGQNEVRQLVDPLIREINSKAEVAVTSYTYTSVVTLTHMHYAKEKLVFGYEKQVYPDANMMRLLRSCRASEAARLA